MSRFQNVTFKKNYTEKIKGTPLPLLIRLIIRLIICKTFEILCWILTNLLKLLYPMKSKWIFYLIREKRYRFPKTVKSLSLISDMNYEKLKPRGSRFGILYGQFKIYKSFIGNCPSFWMILSAIKIHLYNLAKRLVLMCNN